jgi:hypothetical protein
VCGSDKCNGNIRCVAMMGMMKVKGVAVMSVTSVVGAMAVVSIMSVTGVMVAADVWQ